MPEIHFQASRSTALSSRTSPEHTEFWPTRTLGSEENPSGTDGKPRTLLNTGLSHDLVTESESCDRLPAASTPLSPPKQDFLRPHEGYNSEIHSQAHRVEGRQAIPPRSKEIRITQPVLKLVCMHVMRKKRNLGTETDVI